MKNLIIDGGNMLHRAYHISKKTRCISDGNKNVSHIVTFVNNIKYIQQTLYCDRIFITWDIRDDDFVNFRHEAIDYKKQRDKTSHDEIHKYDKVLWKICETLGITNIRANKLEGDDIVYFLCNKYSDCDNYVVSNDKDFLQLFNMFESVKIFNPMKKVLITHETAKDHNGGVDNDKYLLYKSIMGDSSDNIEGLYKYGPVKSKKFVEDFQNNFQTLTESDQNTIKRNLKVMNLKYASRYYDDEQEYFESQDEHPPISISDFFNIVDKLGIKKYMGYKMEWVELFSQNQSNLSDDLQNMINSINN
jgi:DNA polymerase-1